MLGQPIKGILENNDWQNWCWEFKKLNIFSLKELIFNTLNHFSYMQLVLLMALNLGSILTKPPCLWPSWVSHIDVELLVDDDGEIQAVMFCCFGGDDGGGR